MHIVDLNEDPSSATSSSIRRGRNAHHHDNASPAHSVLTASEFGDPDRRGRSRHIGHRAREGGRRAGLLAESIYTRERL